VRKYTIWQPWHLHTGILKEKKTFQVIRVSRSARRLQVARSAFFSLTPDTFREQRI
jgi:hypothetical protein